MPTGYKKKPLGAWPDNKKHEAVEGPQEEGEQSRSGHMPDPEEITGADQDEPKTNLDAAQDVGLYQEYDQEHLGEANLAEEEEENLEGEKQS